MKTNRDLNYRLYIQHEEDFKRTSFSKEFEFYRIISSGNVQRVREIYDEIKNDYSKGKGVLSDDPIKNIRYHFIISVAITARICIEDGMNLDIAYTLADIYINKADKCGSENEIIDMQGEMFADFAERMKEIKKSNAVSIHIRKCIDYIYDHLPEKITVKSAAEHLKINETYLSKLFVKETGTNFRRFIINTKVDIAKNMLINSDLSYLEITLALGFSSQSAFITAFKDITGITPKKFKETCRNL